MSNNLGGKHILRLKKVCLSLIMICCFFYLNWHWAGDFIWRKNLYIFSVADSVENVGVEM